MKVVVFGTGGVGGLLGTVLLDGGCEVKFIARGRHLAAIREQGGLKLVQGWEGGRERLVEIEVAESAQELKDFDPAIVLMCVKYRDLDGAAKACGDCFPSAVIVPMLNGVDAVDMIAKHVDITRVAAGLCRVVAYVQQPGLILNQSRRLQVEFGAWVGDPKTSLLVEFAERFQAGGGAAHVMEDTRRCMWTKMAQMASLGSVCAVTRASIKEVVSIPETRDLFMSAMQEIVEVAKSEGALLPETLPQQCVAGLESASIAQDASVSTARDIQDGRPSELDHLSQKIVELGTRNGVPTPTHKFLMAALLPQQLRSLAKQVS